MRPEAGDLVVISHTQELHLRGKLGFIVEEGQTLVAVEILTNTENVSETQTGSYERRHRWCLPSKSVSVVVKSFSLLMSEMWCGTRYQ